MLRIWNYFKSSNFDNFYHFSSVFVELVQCALFHEWQTETPRKDCWLLKLQTNESTASVELSLSEKITREFFLEFCKTHQNVLKLIGEMRARADSLWNDPCTQLLTQVLMMRSRCYIAPLRQLRSQLATIKLWLSLAETNDKLKTVNVLSRIKYFPRTVWRFHNNWQISREIFWKLSHSKPKILN